MEPRIVEVDLEDPPQTVPTTAETRLTLIKLKRAKKLIRALLKGLHFDTDKTFLLPSAMKGMQMLRRFLAPRPRLSLLIVGHADSKGAAAHNLKLSVQRAQSIQQYLRDDVDAWLTFYGTPPVSKPWGRIEDQHMLSALPGGGAPAFYTGPIHGKDDEPTKSAVKAFQRFSNETRGTTLGDDGICGPLTRKELVTAYMGLDGQTLAAETVVALHGCGESHPEVETGDDVSLEENRRVEIFLFDGPATPPPVDPCPSPAGCAEYPKWREDTKFTIDLSQEPRDVTVKVQEDDGIIPDADVRLEGVDARTGKTGEQGTLLFAMVIPGEYEVSADKAGFREDAVKIVVGEGGAKAKAAPAETKSALADSTGDAPVSDAPVGDGGETVITLEARPGIELYDVVSAPQTSGVLLDLKTKTPAEPLKSRPGPVPGGDQSKAPGTVGLIVNRRPAGNSVRLRWATQGKAAVLLKIDRTAVKQFFEADGQTLRAGLPPKVAHRFGEGKNTDADSITFDVTQLGDGKTADDPATFDIVEDCLFTFDAALTLHEPTSDPDPRKGKVLARSFVRLARKLPDPKILDMAVINRTTGERITSFKDWRDLGFEFSLNDTSVGNDLVISGTIIKAGRGPEIAFINQELKGKDDRNLRGKSKPGQFGDFAPQFVTAPYDVEFEAVLRPADDHWPAKGAKVRIRFDPKEDQRPDLISIREALGMANGSPIELRARNPKRSRTWAETSMSAPVPSKAALESTETPLWSWTLEGPKSADKIVATDVRARVRDLSFASFQVCERIEWDRVSITPKGSTKDSIPLPYDPSFFLELTTAEDGFHPGNPLNDPAARGHYWKLRAHLDKSIQLVFGYEVVDGQPPRPLNRVAGQDPLDAKLFPRCPKPAPVGNLEGSAPPLPDKEPLRVCVVVSLVTHREFNEYAPGHVLGVGRIYPFVLVLSNKELGRAEHRVMVKRPDKTARALPGIDNIVPEPCCLEMREEMGAVLFTDNNVMRVPQILDDVEPRLRLGNFMQDMKDKAPAELYSGLPIWNNFFDWYEPEPRSEDFRAVTLDGPGGVFKEAISILRFPAMELVPKTQPIRVEPHRRKAEPGKQNPRYVRHDVIKVFRQGEFDNLHQAPKMFLTKDLLNRPDNKKRFAARKPEAGEPNKLGASGDSWGLEHVTMAPFCVHDCFHTHWRWSEDFKFDFVSGWGPGFDPYMKPGGALIPENQSLRIKFDAPGTVAYTSTIHGAEAGRWQVANHFGSAYALKLHPPEKVLTNSINVMARLLEEPLIDGIENKVSWTRFYWRLRYGGTDDQPMERLKVTPKERNDLRLAGLDKA